MPRILVLADEFYAALAAVRALRGAGHEPWVGSMTPDGYAQRSRAAEGLLTLPAPSAGEEQFVAAVTAAAARCRADAVLACNESTTFVLSGQGIPGLPAAEPIRRATDKQSLAALAAEAGIASPPGIAIERGSPAPSGVRFPAVLKPLRSAIERDGDVHEAPDAMRVETADELRRELESRPDVPWLVQPYLRGRLHGVAGVADRGRVVCSVHQVSRRIYPRDCGGSSYAETVPRDERLDEGLHRLHEALGLTGIWHAQFVANDEGACLIDLNPRPYGSLALAVAAGANLPAIWVDVVLGREPVVTDYRVGHRYRAEMRDLGFLREAVAARDVRAVAAVLVPRARTAHAVLSLRDPGPAARLLRRIAARASG